MKKYLSIALVLFSLLTVRPVLAQQYSPFDLSQSIALQPVPAFRSTSTMHGSGSAWQSQPVINANGIAEYPAPSYASSGPRRITPPTPENKPTPIGDGEWFMLILALACALGTFVHRHRKHTAGIAMLAACLPALAQQPVAVGGGSYASFAPLSASYTAERGGSQAYQMEHRKLYLPDSLLQRLGTPNGTAQGTMAIPTNDWWTHALVNTWTGKIWGYPYWVEATAQGVEIACPDHWEETGCEVKWQTPLNLTFTNNRTGKRAAFNEALVDSWSDFSMSFIMQDGPAWVRVTCVHGSPVIWVEAQDITVNAVNPDEQQFLVSQCTAQGKQWTAVALLTDGLDATTLTPYLQRIPRYTHIQYDYTAAEANLSTSFSITTEDILTGSLSATAPCLMGFLPHHYYHPANLSSGNAATYTQTTAAYLTPRGTMRVFEGNNFTFHYTVNGMLPFFPQPLEWAEGFSPDRMQALNADYAAHGTFGGDTYWGGKGLTQMMHYMTFALQMGDTATFRLAKDRLKTTLIDWYTYTPGEQRMYFARYNRWGALVGFDCSYDSDTFNDHHFHYGYFVYASAVLCMLDDDFREQYGDMARQVARDYANWERSADQPWFRTLDPYCGHSFAGGLGNSGNGNGQESTSEAIQGWGGVWMLGAALGDNEMLNAGIFGYTLETTAAAEYWFDRKRRNIDYTKYQHPYCCNLTMQGVGWWTWFSGDPVWMHSIQWLPVSPVLTNFFCQDPDFTRWDYTQMYQGKEIGDYDAPTGGLGDESGLGNVCLSYLSLFEPDSAARIWERMDNQGKALARNTDTGGITYWLTHAHRGLGEKRYDILSDCPLACAYTDTTTRITTFAVYNAGTQPLTVRFFGAEEQTITADPGLTLTNGTATHHVATIADDTTLIPADEWAWTLPYPNLALDKPVTASSFENVGTLPQGVNDGNMNTRWGSGHSNNEFITIDLGDSCYIDHLILRWETAYASRYAISLSFDGNEWNTITLTSAGGTEQVPLAQKMMSESMPARGRYLRLTGIERATAYGTSLYEIEAYGRPLHADPSQVCTIDLTAGQTVLTEGGTTTLTATAYNVQGEVLNTNITYALVSGPATLNGNLLTANGAGEVIVTATTGSVTAGLTLIVLEGEQISRLTVSPEEVSLPVGDEQRFTVCPVNQFGYASDTCFYRFRATRVCDTTLVFNCAGLQATAVVHVLPYADMNLALGKPATCSGFENNSMDAGKAFDGDLETRWSSRFLDNEWIEVDLLDCYLLRSVRLVWQTAYATAYELLLSSDAVNYQSVYSTTNATGDTVTISLPLTDGVGPQAQFVRLVCHQRATQYGSSLFEMEVYGSGRCTPLPDDWTSVPPATYSDPDGHTTPNAVKVLRNGQLYILHHGVLYLPDGRPATP